MLFQNIGKRIMNSLSTNTMPNNKRFADLAVKWQTFRSHTVQSSNECWNVCTKQGVRCSRHLPYIYFGIFTNNYDKLTFQTRQKRTVLRKLTTDLLQITTLFGGRVYVVLPTGWYFLSLKRFLAA